MKKSEKPFIWVNKKWCKRCGFCKEFCPKDVFEMDPEGFPEPKHIKHCVQCGLCVIQCPDYAIVDDEETKEKLIEEFILEQ
ncbi:MAG: 4Fe-4S dicluster domain-containing protein [Candidatus Abyssobacteria bacterium SURF_17]|uniref:4Fe-4S dicluster domain-containing protein n=1 Tax=Candidatus Abyssobacteria bacterium SURF_17 TaxID=2093361 RepID=A0A419F5Z7_9BACT|nr:MAG: 4Fe-4S dicluster domain-containing protein [Candidatus Abyssubacteria bacterium SURF_17]